jgi:hypothetical protein
MIYTSKHNLKIINRMRKIADRVNPVMRQEKVLARQLAGYSRGGERERSHKKLVGNVVRRNMDKRLNTIGKVHDRIEKIYKRHIGRARGIM